MHVFNESNVFILFHFLWGCFGFSWGAGAPASPSLAPPMSGCQTVKCRFTKLNDWPKPSRDNCRLEQWTWCKVKASREVGAWRKFFMIGRQSCLSGCGDRYGVVVLIYLRNASFQHTHCSRLQLPPVSLKLILNAIGYLTKGWSSSICPAPCLLVLVEIMSPQRHFSGPSTEHSKIQPVSKCCCHKYLITATRIRPQHSVSVIKTHKHTL